MGHYIVTGASGFIASKISELLLIKGHKISGIDNMNDAYDTSLKQYRLNKLIKHSNFDYSNIDITDNNALKKSIRSNIEGIINLGARAGVRNSEKDPHIYFDTNLTGTLNLLELCKKYEIPKFVLASTSSVYGKSNSLPYSESDNTDHPISQYAASKKAAETLSYTYHHLYGLDVSILRYFTVYGPASRPDMAIMKFVKWIIEGEEVKVYGDGTQSRDFTYINDIAEGTISSLQNLGYETINLGSDNPTTVSKIISIIEAHSNQQARVKYFDENPLDVKSTWANIKKAKNILGWVPTTDISDGLKDCVNWYEHNRHWAKNIELS